MGKSVIEIDGGEISISETGGNVYVEIESHGDVGSNINFKMTSERARAFAAELLDAAEGADI